MFKGTSSSDGPRGLEEGSRELLRFYVQIRDEEDLAMLAIPPKFVEVMKEWLTVKLSRVVRILPNDLVVVRISDLGLKVQIYNHGSSIECRVHCSTHCCIGDLAFAL
ncbi:hypothetical protein D1007_18863 [Hordeum vulgare]|nr:hypothetical protein D1007_18863 [Hordeum vulgare]